MGRVGGSMVRSRWAWVMVACGFAWGCGQSDDPGVSVGECPGYEPPSIGSDAPLCRSDTDCSGSQQTCLMPRACQPVGVDAGAPTFECAKDEECAGGVCIAGNSCSGQYSYCQPACTADSCPVDSTCGTDGHCKPNRCEDGYACPENTRCDASTGGHGCKRMACTEDAQCDCGPCLDGLCEGAFGRCIGPAA